MSDWIKTHNVAFHNYWNYPASDYNGVLKNNPKSEAAFLEQWGNNTGGT